MSHVLFVCIQNAGRSQIAQALFERAADARHEARSAGSRPAEHVHPEVVQVMRELDIDVSKNVPHKLDQTDMEWADTVVTMGCGDECPYIPGKRYIDWELTDPARQPTEIVRTVRDEIASRVDALLTDLGSGNSTPKDATPYGMRSATTILVQPADEASLQAPACSLDRAALASRRQEWAALRRQAMISHSRASGLAVSNWRRSDEVRDELIRLMKAEATCCPFLGFEMDERADELVLRVTLPEGADSNMWNFAG